MSEATELKAYTLADVSSHNNESSCWVVIHGKVYDVTKYLEDHPGGEDVLLGVGGKEATEEFEDQGHSETARGLLKNYLIGTCEEKDPTKIKRAQDEENFPPIRQNKTIPSMFRILLPILILALAIFYAYYNSTEMEKMFVAREPTRRDQESTPQFKRFAFLKNAAICAVRRNETKLAAYFGYRALRFAAECGFNLTTQTRNQLCNKCGFPNMHLLDLDTLNTSQTHSMSNLVSPCEICGVDEKLPENVKH